MKRTYQKLIFRGIRGTANRFLSIFAIVALGAGFLAGLLATSPDMKRTADLYFDAQRAYDLNVKGTLGITSEDVEAVRTLDGVETARGAYVMDAITSDSDGETYTARIFGIDFAAYESDPAYNNRFLLIEGRLPEKAGECVVEIQNPYTNSCAVGETITILSPDADTTEDDLLETYKTLTYTVVGLAKSPAFLSISGEPSRVGSGKVALALYVPEADFALDVYTDIFLELDGARELDTFSDEYETLTSDAADAMTAFAAERAGLRRASVVSEAEQKLNDARTELERERADAQAKLDDARAELDDAQAELADGRAQIVDAEQTLSDAEAELASGRTQLADAEAELETHEQTLADGRVQLAEAETQLASGEAELADGETQFAAAERELIAREREFSDGEAALAEAEAQLDAGQSELDAYAEQVATAKALLEAGVTLSDEVMARIAEYDAGVAEIAAGRAEIAAQRTALEEARPQLETGRAELERNRTTLAAARAEIESGRAEIARNRRELNNAETQLADGRAEIARSRQELDDGARELADGRAKLEEKRAELADAEQTLADAEQEYADAQTEFAAKIADAEREIADAEAEIADIDESKWLLYTRREGNAGFSSYEDDIDKVAAISKVFPVFFFLVAALVALTTMTRMIDEERPRIGALQSLGYTNGSILSYYLIYAGLASVTGAAVGILLGMKALPLVISNAYSMMYVILDTVTPLHPTIAFSVGAAIVAVILLTTVLACRGSLKERPAALLVPKAPAAGKRILLERIPLLWKRLGFTQKVTARNLFRYKKRFLMTIIGIAGCAALLVTGFGVRDSISDIVEKQYNELYLYDISLSLMDENDVTDNEEIHAYLSDKTQVSHWTAMHTEKATVRKAGVDEVGEVTLSIPQTPSELAASISLRNRKTHEPVPFQDSSVVIAEKMSEPLSLKVGDTIAIENADGEIRNFPVTGITENYVAAFVYMSPAVYAAYDSEPAYTTLYITLPEGTDAAAQNDVVTKKLLDAGAAYCLFSETVRTSFSDSVKSIDYIVMVLIFCAGALAIIVLYNLTNINICERKKELATIKVLGFFDKEVSSYIFRETNILACIGCAAGLLGGIFLHTFVMRTVEVDAVMFGRQIYPLSYVYAAVITVIFTLLVNLLMTRRLKQIDMVESMKAND